MYTPVQYILGITVLPNYRARVFLHPLHCITCALYAHAAVDYDNTVAIAKKTKKKQKTSKQKKTTQEKHTKNTHRETRKGSRAVKYFHQPRLSGEEDGEPKWQHSLSRGGSTCMVRASSTFRKRSWRVNKERVTTRSRPV